MRHPATRTRCLRQSMSHAHLQGVCQHHCQLRKGTWPQGTDQIGSGRGAPGDVQDFGWESFSDEEEYLAERLSLVRKCKNRIEEARLIKFYRRLDSGWNRSRSRFCGGCNKFKSTAQHYWDKKSMGWLYKFSGRVAQGYRIMRDCRCACTPEKAIKKWVDHAADKEKQSLWCPECVFGDTIQQHQCCGDFCECCYENCGCHGCPCGPGCRYH